MIHMNSITVVLGNQTILEDFSLKIEQGEKVAISGESGSGKSTLLKTLIGMHVPQRGRIHIAGLALDAANIASIRNQMFYLPQDIQPQDDETALEYLKTPFRLAVNRGIPFPEDTLDDLFFRMRLKDELKHQPLYRLSGGERKRVGVLCGLLLGRKIFLADEPTAGVDAANRDVITDILFGDKALTVVAVTHDESLIELATHRIQLKNLGLAGVPRGR
jgi:ABC-type multidrug transport system ATPase subunit